MKKNEQRKKKNENGKKMERKRLLLLYLYFTALTGYKVVYSVLRVMNYFPHCSFFPSIALQSLLHSYFHSKSSNELHSSFLPIQGFTPVTSHATSAGPCQLPSSCSNCKNDFWVQHSEIFSQESLFFGTGSRVEDSSNATIWTFSSSGSIIIYHPCHPCPSLPALTSILLTPFSNPLPWRALEPSVEWALGEKAHIPWCLFHCFKSSLLAKRVNSASRVQISP